MTKSMAEYIDAVRQAVEDIGRKGPSAVPNVNDPVTSTEQEYAIASMLARLANERREAARNALIALHQIPDQYGEHMLDDNRYVVVSVRRQRGPAFLPKDAIKTMLVKEFNLSVEGADKLMSEYSKTGADTFIFNALLKQ